MGIEDIGYGLDLIDNTEALTYAGTFLLGSAFAAYDKFKKEIKATLFLGAVATTSHFIMNAHEGMHAAQAVLAAGFEGVAPVYLAKKGVDAVSGLVPSVKVAASNFKQNIFDMASLYATDKYKF